MNAATETKNGKSSKPTTTAKKPAAEKPAAEKPVPRTRVAIDPMIRSMLEGKKADQEIIKSVLKEYSLRRVDADFAERRSQEKLNAWKKELGLNGAVKNGKDKATSGKKEGK